MIANPNVRPIPQPTSDLLSVVTVVVALKEGVESLAGQRGGPYDRAVTFNDLIRLGLVSEAQVRALQA